MTTRVLVADDDPTLRDLLSEIMADDGHEIDPAADGDEAIAAMTRQRPDLVLTDLRMPGVDGLRVVDAARRCDPPAPVIVLTAFGSVPKAVEAMRRGAFDFVTKPIESPKALRALAAKAIASRGGASADPEASGAGAAAKGDRRTGGGAPSTGARVTGNDSDKTLPRRNKTQVLAAPAANRSNTEVRRFGLCVKCREPGHKAAECKKEDSVAYAGHR